MGYVLYIANKRYSSWSMRPWVLLRALSIPFEERLRPFAQPFGPGIRQPAFVAFSPSGKVPCLHVVDDEEHHHDDNDKGEERGAEDGKGTLVVWDSLAICETIAESHPEVWPADVAARAFARSAAAEMHSGFTALRDQCSMNCALRIELPETLLPLPGSDGGGELAAELGRLRALFEEGLRRFGGPWLAGSGFSVADAFFAPVAVRAWSYGLGAHLGEQAGAYLDRLMGHEAVREWVEAGRKEPWREAMHEKDCIDGRKVLEDLSEGC